MLKFFAYRARARIISRIIFLINGPIIIHIMTCGAVGPFLANDYFDASDFRRRKVLFVPVFLMETGVDHKMACSRKMRK
jgi:hypothetical protein